MFENLEEMLGNPCQRGNISEAQTAITRLLEFYRKIGILSRELKVHKSDDEIPEPVAYEVEKIKTGVIRIRFQIDGIEEKFTVDVVDGCYNELVDPDTYGSWALMRKLDEEIRRAEEDVDIEYTILGEKIDRVDRLKKMKKEGI